MDQSSFANPYETVVTHLDWNAVVYFETETIRAVATYTFQRLSKGATKIILDTSKFQIHSVRSSSGETLAYKLDSIPKGKEHLGQRLEVSLPKSAEDKIFISYSVSNESTALQWLPPAQTAGKVHPYLFTQCQAIHARALIPCQDQPGVKMTYTATVKVPEWATCVMSALESKPADTSTESDSRTFYFEQRVPMSSYLFAIAVGNLVKRDISHRCAVWSEPQVVEAAAYEFSQTEEFLSLAEDISGRPYDWGRYDLLCLPPSFPYGGMENPCLTFVTPTLLAGDRSLADTVAHEIAHSWTGNLVTNATWDHFWLNEGWTVWFQRKIMGRIKKNPKFIDFDAIAGRKSLSDAVSTMPEKNTSLVLNIGDGDPDDSYSKVAYEKGFSFLLYLERLVGTVAFEAFFRAYIKEFASKTLTSTDFRKLFVKFFEEKDVISEIDWKAWLHGTGMPPVQVDLDKSMAEASQQLSDQWFAVDRAGQHPPESNAIVSWSTQQVACFLDDLQMKVSDCPLQLHTIRTMDAMYNFSKSLNSEILLRYCVIAIQAEDELILPVAIRFATTQGRMKFTRPIYRALYRSKMGRDIAVSTFLANKDFYHPICAKMVALDLRLRKKAWLSLEMDTQHQLIVGGVLIGLAAALVGYARR